MAGERVIEGEQRLGVGLAILALIALQLFAPNDYAFEPVWLLPALEMALFATLAVANPFRINRESTVLRVLSLLLVGIASFATAWSVVALTDAMITDHEMTAVKLVGNGATIWLTNIIVFALWYWEFDRGGPAARANGRQPYPDFLFPQMTSPQLAERGWQAEFTDYLYVSFTNAAAYSPTDTMPLSRWAKMAMMFQSAISLITVVLVIARAVNVVGGA